MEKATKKLKINKRFISDMLVLFSSNKGQLYTPISVVGIGITYVRLYISPPCWILAVHQGQINHSHISHPTVTNPHPPSKMHPSFPSCTIIPPPVYNTIIIYNRYYII